MFGGPIDMTPFGAIVKGIGVIYWLLVLGALALALWKPKRWGLKLSLSGIVLAAGVVPVAFYAYQEYQQQKQSKARLDAAMAHFEMRCKSAGEKIYRTVESVEGVVWMKWRPKWANSDDQFSMDDPYGSDCGGESCIKLLLRATKGLELDSGKKKRFRHGYGYVESVDPADGRPYRYVMHLAEGGLDRQLLERKLIEKPTADYGITWDDISTMEDRDRWVAGSLLKIIDTKTNEVIAERIGYMIDRGLGDRNGSRSPWLMAERFACPAFDRSGDSFSRWSRTTGFVLKVLKPFKEE